MRSILNRLQSLTKSTLLSTGERLILEHKIRLNLQHIDTCPITVGSFRNRRLDSICSSRLVVCFRPITWALWSSRVSAKDRHDSFLLESGSQKVYYVGMAFFSNPTTVRWRPHGINKALTDQVDKKNKKVVTDHVDNTNRKSSQRHSETTPKKKTWMSHRFKLTVYQ